MLYVDANNLYVWAMYPSLLYDEINFERNLCLEVIINTPYDSDIGYFLKVDLKYPHKKDKKRNISPLLLKIKLYLKTILMII